MDAEKGLEEYRSASEISFLDYLYYIKVELFALLSKKEEENANFDLTASINKDVDLNKIDEVCWLVCSKKYVVRPLKLVNDDCVYKLWRIYNFHAESDEDGELLYPVVVHGEEIAIILHKLVLACGRKTDPGYVESIVTKDKQYRWVVAPVPGFPVGALSCVVSSRQSVADYVSSLFQATQMHPVLHRYANHWCEDAMPRILAPLCVQDASKCIEIDTGLQVTPLGVRRVPGASRSPRVLWCIPSQCRRKDRGSSELGTREE